MSDQRPIRIDFICPKNAGRSQVAAVFAERERARRGLDDVVEIHSAGTRPADRVHDEVVAAMDELGVDLAERTPKFVVLEDLEESHFVITMGCTVAEFNPSHYGVESRVWPLMNPEGEEMDLVRAVRDETEQRVVALFDEIEAIAEDRAAERSLSERVVDAVSSALRADSS
ncbi:low molecular weight phosphatase family protein [Halobellus sp. Atlit-31R]|nr:low molecular weight phosphatase family protein [Halobellus sp. Atlit-31R]